MQVQIVCTRMQNDKKGILNLVMNLITIRGQNKRCLMTPVIKEYVIYVCLYLIC